PQLRSSQCRGADALAIRIAIRDQLVDPVRTPDGSCLPTADVWLRSVGDPELRTEDPGARVHVVPRILASTAESHSLGVPPGHVCSRPPRHEHSFAYAYPRSIRMQQLLCVCDVYWCGRPGRLRTAAAPARRL